VRGGVEVEVGPIGELEDGEGAVAETVELDLGFPAGDARKETLFLRRVTAR
jgi:hypothetical protein